MLATTPLTARARATDRTRMMDVSAKTVFPSVLLVCLVAGGVRLPGATASETLPVIPKWGRFEQTYVSSVVYADAPQQATLTFLFTSPLGQTNRVDAFWDGGQTWRARFSPNQAGRWSYLTLCSDRANKGLHRRCPGCTRAHGASGSQTRPGPPRDRRSPVLFHILVRCRRRNPRR